MKKSENKILILGAGRRGLATIEILNDDPEIEIVAVVDINPNASGIKLAQRLGIKTDSDWEKYIEGPEPPNAVLNLTDNSEIQKSLLEKTRGKDIEILGSVTQRLLSNLLVERQVQAELHRVSQRIASKIGLDELMVLILSSCVKSTKADGGIIILFNEVEKSWEIKSNWGIQDDIEEQLLAMVSEKLPVWLEKDEALPLAGIETDGGVPELETALCAPLRWRGEVKGAIIVVNKTLKKFSAASQRLLSTFANQSAVAIENTLLYKKSQHLSITDGLTGVFNHRYFQEQLETELSRAQRYDLNFSLMIVDLDNFKDINDTYGHLIGDEVLRKVSFFIKKTVRETDSVARYGGDEFVILLPETPKKGAMIVGERIRKGISEIKVSGSVSVNVSLGLAGYPDDAVYSEDLVKKADKALYRAKEGGRNKICAA